MIKWMTCCAFPDTSNRDTAGKMPLHRRVLKASYSPARQVREECVNDRSFHAKLRSYVPVAFLTPAARSFFLVSANHTRASTKVKDGNLQERIIGLAYSRWHPGGKRSDVWGGKDTYLIRDFYFPSDASVVYLPGRDSSRRVSQLRYFTLKCLTLILHSLTL